MNYTVDRLAEPFADAGQRNEIVDAVQRLDEIAVAGLAGLSGVATPVARRPRSRGRL